MCEQNFGIKLRQVKLLYIKVLLAGVLYQSFVRTFMKKHTHTHTNQNTYKQTLTRTHTLSPDVHQQEARQKNGHRKCSTKTVGQIDLF